MKHIRRRKKVMIIIAVICALLIVIKGVDYLMLNQFKKSSDYNNFITKYVEIDGDKLFYYENEYDPKKETVVFLSGSGVSSTYVDMYCLWEPISNRANVIFYDRPGMGKSSVSKRSRKIDTVVNDLNKVLDACESDGPYIIVAHSMASLEAMRFAQLNPKKVKSILFIDGASLSFAKEFKDTMKSLAPVLGGARKTGLLRLLCKVESFSNQFKISAGIPKEVNELGLQLTLQNLWNISMINERKELSSSAKTISESGNLGDLPIVILSADNNGMNNWTSYQNDLKKVSSNSKQIVYNGGHFIHHEHTEDVIEQITKLMKMDTEEDQE